MGYRPKTLRRMPPETRKIARLINEAESTARRLANLLPTIQRMELDARALAATMPKTKNNGHDPEGHELFEVSDAR